MRIGAHHRHAGGPARQPPPPDLLARRHGALLLGGHAGGARAVEELRGVAGRVLGGVERGFGGWRVQAVGEAKQLALQIRHSPLNIRNLHMKPARLEFACLPHFALELGICTPN